MHSLTYNAFIAYLTKYLCPHKSRNVLDIHSDTNRLKHINVNGLSHDLQQAIFTKHGLVVVNWALWNYCHWNFKNIHNFHIKKPNWKYYFQNDRLLISASLNVLRIEYWFCDNYIPKVISSLTYTICFWYSTCEYITFVTHMYRTINFAAAKFLSDISTDIIFNMINTLDLARKFCHRNIHLENKPKTLQNDWPLSGTPIVVIRTSYVTRFITLWDVFQCTTYGDLYDPTRWASNRHRGF